MIELFAVSRLQASQSLPGLIRYPPSAPSRGINNVKKRFSQKLASRKCKNINFLQHPVFGTVRHVIAFHAHCAGVRRAVSFLSLFGALSTISCAV